MTMISSHLADGTGNLQYALSYPPQAFLASPAFGARARPFHQRTYHRADRRLSLVSAAVTSSPVQKEACGAHNASLPSVGDADARNSAAADRHVITAVVVGASMAGLLTAAALADWCKEVVVVDKDDCVDDAATTWEELQEQIFNGEDRGSTYVSRAKQRKGVPQYGQLHGLLGKGAQAIESLLPGWKAVASQLGAISYQPGLLRTYYKGEWTYHPSAESEFVTLTASRDLIETSCRKQLLALKPNVRIRGGEPVQDLLWAEDRSSVHGVVMRSGAVIKGDLVVDASGRRSKMPAWLEAAGYQAPAEEEIDPKVGYSVRVYEMPEEAKRDNSWASIYIRPSPPATRGGALIKAEGGKYIAGMIGYSGDIPPNDEAGHVEFIKSIQPTDLWEALQAAKPLTKPAGYSGTTNLRRAYERERLPAGVAVVGDAVCAFNPVYGQGMTVAAMEAEALRSMLRERAPSGQLTREQVPGLAVALQQAIGEIVVFPYQAATGEDFSFPATEGKRPEKTWQDRLMDGFLGELVSLQATDEDTFRAVTPVFHMIKGPEALMTPNLVMKALISRLLRAVKGHT